MQVQSIGAELQRKRKKKSILKVYYMFTRWRPTNDLRLIYTIRMTAYLKLTSKDGLYLFLHLHVHVFKTAAGLSFEALPQK